MKRFMVLGSNSFSGSHFCKHLIDEGCEVLATSRSAEFADVFLPYKWAGIPNSDLSFVQLDLNKDEHQVEDVRILNQDPDEKNTQDWFQPRIIFKVPVHS